MVNIEPPVAAEATTTLYVSHFCGKVYTMILANTGDKYSLTQTAAVDLPGRPSWLTWDEHEQLLYVNDEELEKKEGVLSVLEAAKEEGQLSVKAKVPSPHGSVASTLYGGPQGNSYIANAHYGAGIVTSYPLPLDSATTTKPRQTFEYTLPGPGANPKRQEASHPHHILPDPSGSFLVVPDLGADLVRTYAIDKKTGHLVPLPPIEAPIKGDGSRHAVFWKSAPSSLEDHKPLHEGTWLYIANELANTVNVYAVTYAPDTMLPSFSLKQTISTYGDKPAPEYSTLAAIKVKDNDMYVSNRRDAAFGTASDSITHFSIDPSNGLLTFRELSPSHGSNPRAFEISPLGDLVAIANKGTMNLVVVKRDGVTGRLGEKVAEAKIGESDGLSAVVFV